jgi:hypothetical protein
MVREYVPLEYSITAHRTLLDIPVGAGVMPCHATDVYTLGLMTWFMQNGDKTISNNYILASRLFLV